MKIDQKMVHYFLAIVTLLCMVVVGSHASSAPETFANTGESLIEMVVEGSDASSAPEIYWKSVFPNTPMPLAIINSLSHPELMKNKGEAHIAKGLRWWYHYAADPKFYVDPTQSLFFLEKDMKVGSHMTFEFTESHNGATFLPREEANAIPFSSDKVPQILRKFSFEPDSADAQIMKDTLTECEAKGILGEGKSCPTSLESMVDYATLKLGKNIKAISTVKLNNYNKIDNYVITGIKKTAREDKNMVCHKQNYAYAVFYCHTTTFTKSYLVSLVGLNGSRVNAVAVCHSDTSGWNPKHFALQSLNVKAGTVPVCHFLAEDDQVLWVPDN